MTLSVELDLQYASAADDDLPTKDDVRNWVTTALQGRHIEPVALTIRFVDEVESAELNEAYRKKTGPTNVLSFPYEGMALTPALLGDIIICAPVVMREAQAQQKAIKSHWCHMVIHGVLHLLGYDHINEQEADEMETEEVELMAALGYTNPYLPNYLSK